jgi:hypothetical protein
MKRRNFLYNSLAVGALPLVGMAKTAVADTAQQKELYEIRTYDIKFRANRQVLEDYLLKILAPTLYEGGITHCMVLGEFGQTDPPKLWVFIAYPSATSYLQSQNLHSDPAYVARAEAYNKLAPEEALFTRYESSLLLAFDGFPAMQKPDETTSLFELRTYEGYSEDAVRRKIAMFNKGEIEIFLQTGLDPVFFGEMLAGPYRPCLTYMLGFKDMDERDANWQEFIGHPSWKEMSAREEYANTVSNIRRVFLKPIRKSM